MFVGVLVCVVVTLGVGVEVPKIPIMSESISHGGVPVTLGVGVGV